MDSPRGFATGARRDDWQPGSTVRGTGICIAGRTNFLRPTGLWVADDLQLWLRRAADVKVLRAAPWLTMGRALALVLAFTGAMLLALIVMAVVAVRLLRISGLVLLGGLLLLWVCWKMWGEIRRTAEAEALAPSADADGVVAEESGKTLWEAATQIIVADVSMSLDNVLAVAGAAQEQPVILAIGLVLSIALMGLAASFIASLLNRYRWISYVGLAIILYVAGSMIWQGALDVWDVAAA